MEVQTGDEAARMSIEVVNLTKTFGGTFRALDNVSLRVATGELVALLGPSGSGKTTLLRIIAGLETPDPVGGGTVRFHDEDMTARRVGDRKVGFVFQHYALFRHMTVFDNVSFGLRVRPRAQRPSKAEIRDRVRKLLSLVQMEGLAGRYPHELSGGQRQRVALARALAVEPKVLLLDEPFGALDAKVRRELRRWLRRLHDEVHITSVFVTHDQEEALEVADRVAVLNKGRVEQIGTPTEVYEHPANKFVYNFLGNVNLFHGRISNGVFQPVGNAEAAGANPPSAVYVRPHDIDLARAATTPVDIRARIDHVSPAGPVVRIYLVRLDTQEVVEAELARDRFVELAPKVGDEVYLVLRNARTFAEDYSI
jgi:sulfate transport system ATP-binding protein